MTPLQFDAVCKIAGIGKSSPKHRIALAQVKLQGKTKKEAAEAVGIQANNLSMTEARFNKGLRLAYIAIVGEEPKE